MNRLFAILARYRPTLNRFIYVLALLGLLNTGHLAIQQSRGFDQGCFGGAVPTLLSTTTDCGSVVQSEASTLLGVSNTTWGLLFYATVAAGSFSLLFVSRRWSALIRAGRAVLIFFAFAYSVYLVYYQIAELTQICLLCMISATLASGLFVAQLIGLLHHPTYTFARPEGPYRRRREARLFIGLAFVVGLVFAADMVYFKYYAEPVDPMEQLLEEEFGALTEPGGINQV